MDFSRVQTSSHDSPAPSMSVAGGGTSFPPGVPGASSATKSSAPASVAPLTEDEVKDLIQRINVNQEYQIVLKEAQKALDKALARNIELQVRFWPLWPSIFLHSASLHSQDSFTNGLTTISVGNIDTARVSEGVEFQAKTRASRWSSNARSRRSQVRRGQAS